MVQRHWLDPLARNILRVTGHLPSKQKNDRSFLKFRNAIDRELNALKKQSTHSRNGSFAKVDVNRATASDWRQLPGCTNKMVELLLRLQKGGVQLSSSEDLFKLLELPANTADKWEPYLIFQWYGEAPPVGNSSLIDINSASITTLKRKLKWPEARLHNLIRARQQQPFENLADLQERLSLPPLAIEKLIGIVQFGSTSAGPLLPPRR